MSEKGIIHHLPLMLVVVVAVVAGYLFLQGKVDLSIFSKKPTVELKEEYQNPFKKETQFVNPFEQYKNPFTVNR